LLWLGERQGNLAYFQYWHKLNNCTK
jgi:hypothetical protein